MSWAAAAANALDSQGGTKLRNVLKRAVHLRAAKPRRYTTADSLPRSSRPAYTKYSDFYNARVGALGQRARLCARARARVRARVRWVCGGGAKHAVLHQDFGQLVVTIFKMRCEFLQFNV